MNGTLMQQETVCIEDDNVLRISSNALIEANVTERE